MATNTLVVFLVGFLVVAISANEISKVFQKIKFPLITGLIITGIVAGSSVLNFIPHEAVDKLHFLNEIALAIIAFSAGSELYLDDLRSRINSIKWMTIGQLVITFVLSSLVIYFIADAIPFMADLPSMSKIAISILFGTIFVARSPSSAIAVINEMRANGPFTKTVMGVTVVKDVLVIILFAICFSVAKAFINGETIGFLFLGILALELLASFGIGYLLGKLLQVPFAFKIPKLAKELLIIIIGYSIYLFAHFVEIQSLEMFNHGFVIEPLLICIIGSFVLTNYSKHRIEFSELLEEISPIIYIIFFTLTGASLSLQVLMSVFGIALGITVDNAILFLAKYRQELRAHSWDVKHAILLSLRETGLGIFYTSVILFFGFIMFVFSQFGGTKGLGLLVSITILVGMVTNLIILPSLLLTFERNSFVKSFEEPYFDIYDEETDYDTDKLEVEIEGIRKEIEG